MPIPGAIPRDTHLFVVGDINGRATALNAAISWMKNNTKGQSKFISLGNTMGHGNENRKTLEILNTLPFDEKILLPGYQEIQFIKALKCPQQFSLWEAAGGMAILEEYDLATLPTEKTQEILKTHFASYQNQILNAKSHYTFGDCLMVSAGISPHIPLKKFLDQPHQQETPFSCHWSSIQDPFLSWKNGWNKEKTTLVIHGYTPAIENSFSSWTDITQLYKPDHYRTNLNAGSKTLQQIAWAEILDRFIRIGIVHISNNDTF